MAQHAGGRSFGVHAVLCHNESIFYRAGKVWREVHFQLNELHRGRVLVYRHCVIVPTPTSPLP